MIETVETIVSGFVANPVGFSMLFSIGLAIIYFKWWVLGRTARRALADQRIGLRKGAATREAVHETGIGTTDVTVMRPAFVIWPGILCLLFFGGGAVFYALVVLPSGGTEAKDWGVFAIMLGFTLMGLFLLAGNTTRITNDGSGIRRRGLVVRRFDGHWSGLKEVMPLEKSYTAGIDLHFADGQQLRVRPNLSGYVQLVEHLAFIDPKLRMMARMLRKAA